MSCAPAAPAFVKRSCFQTNSLTVPIAAKQDNGAPRSLVGAKLWLTVKLYPAMADNTSVRQLTIGAGITVDNATAGLATAVIPAGTFQFFGDGPVEFQYDVQMRDAAGNVFTLERGSITAAPSITKATS